MEIPKYWTKQEKPLFGDLEWNFPEQKSGNISVVGGNIQNFSAVNKIATTIATEFPVKDVTAVLPDSLKKQVPPIPGMVFCPATESGSFKKSAELCDALSSADFSVLAGDFSKNSETALAVVEALKSTKTPVILTRDTIDLILNDALDLIEREGVIYLGSMMQMQKLFRAIYYPKVLLLSMPILPVVEALHKFTISYPCTIVTFQEGQILVAKNGDVISTPIEKTSYSPLGLWDGKLAARMAAFALFNPGKITEAIAAALLA